MVRGMSDFQSWNLNRLSPKLFSPSARHVDMLLAQPGEGWIHMGGNRSYDMITDVRKQKRQQSFSSVFDHFKTW